MSPTALLYPTNEASYEVTDADFELDLRVIESVLPGAAMRCDSSDGCGSTCSTSACQSNSNDPY